MSPFNPPPPPPKKNKQERILTEYLQCMLVDNM